ncbi:MAG: outer membrane beta-barrel protein [Burkholderiales bacterium]
MTCPLPTPLPHVRGATRVLFVCALLGACSLVCAQGTSLRLGASAGSSDYGTAFKAQLSDGMRLPFLNGPWRWEGQAARFGSENYVQFSNTYQRSAWALGASVMPQLPLMRSLSAYGKLGAHYLHTEASGPGLSASKSNLKLGYGAGLLWQVAPNIGLKLELENIGGSSGDLVTLGLEVPL